MICEGKQTAINYNFIIDVDLSYKNIEKFRGGFQPYLMSSIGFI